MPRITLQSDGRGRSLTREVVTGAACAWCGSPAKYRYVAGVARWHDAPRPAPLGMSIGNDKVFCGIGCFRDYYS